MSGNFEEIVAHILSLPRLYSPPPLYSLLEECSLSNVSLPTPPTLTALLATVLMREERVVEVVEMIRTKVGAPSNTWIDTRMLWHIHM